MTPSRLYTAGYGGKRAATLARIAEAENALIADCRIRPYSQQPDWNGFELRALLGKRYHPLYAWGNRNYKTGGVSLVDWEIGLNWLLEQSGVVILLCQCRGETQCHLGYIAKRLRMEHRLTSGRLAWNHNDQAAPEPILTLF